MIPVAVRTLCDFAARTGDLDLRYTPAPTSQEGMEGHRRVTTSRDADYQPEYRLHGDCRGLRLGGRADGYHPGAGYLEEIKTHRGDLTRMSAGQRALHWAQLRTYGALLCRNLGLARVTLRLVYYDIQQGKETVLSEEGEAAALWTRLEMFCDRYRRWAEQEVAHRTRRNAALSQLTFPFAAFRAGQRSLAEAVYKTFARQRSALLQAPTGSGKTVGSLYPALLSMPRHHLDRLFYLTVRNTGQSLAMEGLQRIESAQSDGLPLRILALTAREQACEYRERACHGESCPLAKGFYDRLPAARQAAIEQTGPWDPAAVRVRALAHDICPYYFAQELARWADVVVGDVNYFFDQQALLHALTRQNEWQVGVLVDEAHNLIARARGMYSISLSRARLRRIRRQAPPMLKKPLDALTRSWRKLLKMHGANPSGGASGDDVRRLDSVPTELHGALQKTVIAITDYLSEQPAHLHDGQQVGFAVLGGVFSEGIDLPGRRLTGVFIVTLGLPPPDERHEELRKRLSGRFCRGYEYTYLYPGLQKVVQAAGRVIRTPEDRGMVELIDDRFFRREVRALLPAWWPEPQLIRHGAD